MTLQEFALLVGVEPKWVLNAMAALPATARHRYTVPMANRMGIVRAITDGTGISIALAYRLAGAALRALERGDECARLPLAPDRLATLDVDVYRIVAAVNTRRSFLATSYQPTHRGRPRTTRLDPIDAAVAHGIDLTLLDDALRRTPASRLRALDRMGAFRARVRRVADQPAAG